MEVNKEPLIERQIRQLHVMVPLLVLKFAVAGGGASGRFALSGSPAWANSFATMALSCQLFSRGVMPRATKTRS